MLALLVTVGRRPIGCLNTQECARVTFRASLKAGLSVGGLLKLASASAANVAMTRASLA